MPQNSILPKNAVLPDIVGDFPCVVFYVDVAHDKVLDYCWSKLSEVMPTIAVVHEGKKELDGDQNGKK